MVLKSNTRSAEHSSGMLTRCGIVPQPQKHGLPPCPLAAAVLRGVSDALQELVWMELALRTLNRRLAYSHQTRPERTARHRHAMEVSEQLVQVVLDCCNAASLRSNSINSKPTNAASRRHSFSPLDKRFDSHKVFATDHNFRYTASLVAPADMT